MSIQSNRVESLVKQSRIMGRIKYSNHRLNRVKPCVNYRLKMTMVKSWVKEGRNMGQKWLNHVQTGSKCESNQQSNRVQLWVKQGRIMNWSWSNHGSNRVDFHVSNRVDRNEKCRIMSQLGSNSGSDSVKKIEQGRISGQTEKNCGSNRCNFRVKHDR